MVYSFKSLVGYVVPMVILSILTHAVFRANDHRENAPHFIGSECFRTSFFSFSFLILVDYSQPNPNGVEFDNLYIDMNGVIHPCSHPEDRPAPRNEEEIFECIFDALDRMFNIIRPRKLLYLAIDGPAPRAKMNQQRTRRFRAAKESVELANLKAEKKAEIERNGGRLPPPDPKVEKFDSNCITPGTGFMNRLADALRFYVSQR